VGQAAGASAGQRITHLRLVLSASELALLPFELSLSPPGCPGEGQPLLLQGLSPVCITRETRRVPETEVVWPDETRVLFVVAAPAAVPAVPALPHLLALRRMLDPWVGRPEQLGEHLTVLTHASLEAIAAACAGTAFTHVHILAHGCEFRDGYDTRFGLMLHRAGDPGGEADIVSGERLAAALRTPCRNSSGAASASPSASPSASSSASSATGALVGPAVVTLASCNSGNVGSVAGVGASIAHALHEAGIPMVIASQFPLSFGGSVRMVEALYDGLLWGEDPRSLMVALRRQLFAQFPDSHDWASLTVYSSLPADFSNQLAAVQIQRAMTSINVALDLADEVVAGMPPVAASLAAAPAAPSVAAVPAQASTSARVLPTLDATLLRVRNAKQRLQDLVAQYAGQRARILGLLASTEKREAALSHARALRTDPAADAAARARHEADMWAALARARKLYFSCYEQERTPYWTTQYLSLTVLLRGCGRLPAAADTPGRDSAALWTLAEVQSLHDLSSDQAEVRTWAQVRNWAQGNLVELYLLAPAIPGLAPRQPGWTALAEAQTRLLAAGAAEGGFEQFATRRQVARYTDWYGTLAADALPAALLDIAQAVLALLPADPATVEWDYGTA
jgi:hypothetical protein